MPQPPHGSAPMVQAVPFLVITIAGGLTGIVRQGMLRARAEHDGASLAFSTRGCISAVFGVPVWLLGAVLSLASAWLLPVGLPLAFAGVYAVTYFGNLSLYALARRLT